MFAARPRRKDWRVRLPFAGELESRALPSTGSINFSFLNDSGITDPAFIAIYGKEDGIWGEYDLTGSFRAFTNADSFVTTYPLSASQSIPFVNNDLATRIDSGRAVLSFGKPAVLSVNANNGGVNAPNLGNPTDPNADIFYDFVEFTERASDGALFINTTTIDQFGFPLVVTLDPIDTASPNGVGISLARAAVFAQYQAYIQSLVAVDPSAIAFADLANPQFVGSGTLDGQVVPFRIIAPKDLVQFTRDELGNEYNSPLKTYFNDALIALFARNDGFTLSVPNPNFNLAGNSINPGDPQLYSFVARPAVVQNTGSDGQQYSYPVLQFQAMVGGQMQSLNVYRPLFSTNGSGADLPPGPSFLPNPAESPGQMVLANDGVFADNTFQFPASDPGQSLTSRANLLSNLLANIENQLVSALNRGVSTLDPAAWQNPANYYQPGTKANFYSGFLHQTSVSIDGKAYGFPYDDQAGQSSTMAVNNPIAATITLGRWATQPAPNASTERLEELNEYAVQADLTGDGVPEQILGAKPGEAPVLVVRDGATGRELARLPVFEATFLGGVRVAAADLDRDGRTEIFASAGTGGAGIVVIYRGAALAAGNVATAELLRFDALQDASFRGGARIALGDLTGDGIPDLAVTAGTGGGPRVLVWDGAQLRTGRVGMPMANFFAFEESFRGGASVTIADFDADGRVELVVGAGIGGSPRVRVFNAAGLGDGATPAERANFFVGDEQDRQGVLTAARQSDEMLLPVLLAVPVDDKPQTGTLLQATVEPRRRDLVFAPVSLS